MGKGRKHIERFWHFFWHEDSVASFAVNIGIALLVIIYIIYPLLGVFLGTSFPIVAVISESMEHGLHKNTLCGKHYPEFKESFDNYWEACGSWYEERSITKEQFKDFPFEQGFNKGDVIVLWRADWSNVEAGDILIFNGGKAQPIIHRVVKVWEEDGQHFYQTKGDHNPGTISGPNGEEKISEERIYGKGVLRLPYLGWIKIIFVELVRPLGWNIQR